MNWATASGTIIARATDASGEVVAHRAHRVRTRQARQRDARRELQLARTGVVLPVNYLIIRALLQYDQWGSPRTVDIEGGLPGGLAERMFTWRLQEDHSRRSTGLRPLIG